MAREYTKLTVSRETAEWLYEECHRLAEAIRNGQSSVASLTDRAGNQLGCGISADTLIRLMLDDRQKHRERGRRAWKRKVQRLRERKQAELNAQTGPPHASSERVAGRAEGVFLTPGFIDMVELAEEANGAGKGPVG